MAELVRENCGVGLVYDTRDAIVAARAGLSHRGRDAEGYGTASERGINVVRGYSGLLDEQALITLLHHEAGAPITVHTRYKTRGSVGKADLLRLAHPHTIGGGEVFQGNHYVTTNAQESMVHNGTVPFDFSQLGVQAKTGCDTEYLLHTHSIRGPEFVLKTIPASYAVITMHAGDDFVTAYRDRYGRRPLWLGVDGEGRYVVMSEDRSIEVIGGKPIREIRPGELVRVYKNNIESQQVVAPVPRLCYFEVDYFARRRSSLWDVLRKQGVNIEQFRRELGVELFAEHPPLEGIAFVTYVPKSPIDAGRAYASAAGLPLHELFYKINDDRAFLEPDGERRLAAIRDTLFVNPELDPDTIGRDFLAIDDSIVRGTNVPVARKKAESRGFRMRQLGIYTPIVGGTEDGIDLGCEHGVDMPRDDNFIARRAGRDPKKIADALSVDYAGFLSVEGLVSVFERFNIDRGYLCTECIRARDFEPPSSGTPHPYPAAFSAVATG